MLTHIRTLSRCPLETPSAAGWTVSGLNGQPGDGRRLKMVDRPLLHLIRLRRNNTKPLPTDSVCDRLSQQIPVLGQHDHLVAVHVVGEPPWANTLFTSPQPRCCSPRLIRNGRIHMRRKNGTIATPPATGDRGRAVPATACRNYHR